MLITPLELFGGFTISVNCIPILNGYTPPEVTENDAINLITTSTETAISFRLEMTVYSVPPSSITPPVIEEFVFSNVTTSEVGGNQRATLGTIPKTGKIT
nr:hypothetical protein [Xenococcaceae cyanobacterium MO_234.B1]